MSLSLFSNPKSPSLSIDINLPLSSLKANRIIKRRAKARSIVDLSDLYPKFGSGGKKKALPVTRLLKPQTVTLGVEIKPMDV